MPQHHEPWSRHERDRWLRHDAHRFIRHDVKRFLAPGTDPADVYPALARRREAEEAAFAAEIAKGYRLLATLRAEVASIRADLVRRRLEESKYSPTQQRVPAGNPRGGQWTDRSGGGGGFGVAVGADGGGSADGEGVGGEDLGTTADTALAFQADDSSGSLDDWNKLLDRLAGGEQQAEFIQVGSDGKPVTDIDGKPYYSPGGHHEMPKSVFEKWNLDPETRAVFDKSTMGKVPQCCFGPIRMVFPRDIFGMDRTGHTANITKQ